MSDLILVPSYYVVRGWNKVLGVVNIGSLTRLRLLLPLWENSRVSSRIPTFPTRNFDGTSRRGTRYNRRVLKDRDEILLEESVESVMNREGCGSADIYGRMRLTRRRRTRITNLPDEDLPAPSEDIA